ncbi:alpha/beta fold hydrolase [Mucilaginibacter sp.]|jgi:pimeloyl-ACP methyl ester carboxylesterase|uniref:alpha/beta fold hydrolase n=1 Tax=Mucilaginibacter sp. TaxID=1882438 RepID=UPI00356AB577
MTNLKKLSTFIIGIGLLGTYPLEIRAQNVANPPALKTTGSKSNTENPVKTRHKTVVINGIKIFYREAGSPDAPTILLLHGFPSSSRMYNTLITSLADRFHLIAPDYPGFGNSDTPPASKFKYTFDHIAEIVDQFTMAIGLQKYSLFLQDYGGPIGMRLAIAHPERVTSIIIQNAVSHEEGLSPLWEKRRAYWKDRAANEPALMKSLTSPEATKQRHIGTNPHPELIDPDTWNDELTWINKPGELEIQLDLFYDYQNNVASYPKYQTYLRKYQPPMLVVWGKYDPSFTTAGAEAYKKEIPGCEIHILDAGHFALDDNTAEIDRYIRAFFDRL